LTGIGSAPSLIWCRTWFKEVEMSLKYYSGQRSVRFPITFKTKPTRNETELFEAKRNRLKRIRTNWNKTKPNDTRKLVDASVKFGRKILVSDKFHFTSIRGLHQMYFIRQNISICYKCISILKCLPDCWKFKKK
jgi:ABC-type phosphonate transport system ATPase subunit